MLDLKNSKLRKLGSFGFWILALNILRQLSTLLASVVLARTLSQEDFGGYQFVISVIGICGIFALPGMQSVIIQSVARGNFATFRSANLWSLRIAMLGGGVIAVVGLLEWLAGSHQIAVGLFVAAALFAPSNGLANWQSYQNGREQFKVTTLYQGLSLIVGNGLIVCAALLGYTAIWWPVALFYGVAAVQNVRMTRSIFRSIPIDATEESGALKYGFQVSLYNVANYIGNYLDRLLLFYLVDAQALAIYAVADRVPEIFKRNLQSLTNALIPELSRKKAYTPNIDRKFNQVGLILCVVIGLLIFIVIPWLLPLLYGERFSDAVLYCQILLFSMCLGMFATLKFSYIQAKMDAKGARNVILAMSISRILFSLILVPWLGLIGAALSTVAYRVVTFSVVHYCLKRSHMPPPHI